MKNSTELQKKGKEKEDFLRKIWWSFFLGAVWRIF
jgi:hypothetical protein